MLRANVGISRKITRDYNSTGYSVNIDGEIAAALDDPKTVVERIKELWSLAEEALAQEIDRDQGEDAIGRRDEVSDRGSPTSSPEGRVAKPTRPVERPTSGAGPMNGEPATDKQASYLQNLAKRHGLGPKDLDARIGEVTGRETTVSQLTKREAGAVIDSLTQGGKPGYRSNGQR